MILTVAVAILATLWYKEKTKNSPPVSDMDTFSIRDNLMRIRFGKHTFENHEGIQWISWRLGYALFTDMSKPPHLGDEVRVVNNEQIIHLQVVAITEIHIQHVQAWFVRVKYITWSPPKPKQSKIIIKP